jgi:hypothetical protein
MIDIGDVKIYRIPTEENLSDSFLTHAQRKREGHTRSMGMRDAPD